MDWTVDPLIDTTTTPGSGSTSGDLLVKIVFVTGTETVTTTYTYDASKRLIAEKSLGTNGGIPVDSYRRYYRDAAGRIYKVGQLDKQPGITIDTSFLYVYYDNATTKNFKYTITESEVAGFSSRDSSVYTFGSGNATQVMQYLSNDVLNDTVLTKIEFAYTNGNLETMKTYSGYSNSGTLSFAGTVRFTYDNKSNPMILDGEAFITGKFEGASKNNVIKMEIIDKDTPADNITVTTVFTYDASNKPIKGKVNVMPGGEMTDYTFFYQ